MVTMRELPLLLVLLVLACHAGVARAQASKGDLTPATPTSVKPDRWFLQVGAAEPTRAIAAGLIWAWHDAQPWARWGSGAWMGYTELSMARWLNGSSVRWSGASFTQVGLTPVLRYGFTGVSGWFVEAGIGLNLIVPQYRAGERRFSTTFNFGDHLALGWRSGPDPAQGAGWEWSVRLQHFSNAGLRKPNPGTDFVQLRWSMNW